MAIILRNNAAGGTNTTTVTAGNSGGASGHAWDVVTINASDTLTFDNTHVFTGSALAYKVLTGVTSNTCLVEWSSASITSGVTTAWAQVMIRLTANPSATAVIFRIFTGAGVLVAQLGVSSAGKLTTFNAAQTTITTATTALPLNQDVRVDIKVVSSATVGGMVVGAFVTNPYTGTVPDSTYSCTDPMTANTNGGGVNQVNLGITASLASFSYWLGLVGFSDFAALGPPSSPPIPIVVNRPALIRAANF